MGSAQVTIDLDAYDDIIEIPKPKGRNSEDIRLERRWKRFEHSRSSKRSKDDHNDCGTRSTVKSCGNVASFTVKKGHMSHVSDEVEVDEDYKLFLETHDPDIDVVSDGNIDGSDNNINIGHDSYHIDHPYREEKSFHNHHKLDKASKQRNDNGNQRNKGSYSVGKQTSGSVKSKQNLEAKRIHSKKRPRADVSGVPMNNCNSNMELDIVDEDYQIYLNSYRDGYIPDNMNLPSVVQNSQVFDYAMNEVDDDYLQYLNSVLIVNGEVECMPERNTSKTDNVDGESNSSDPDVVLLEPNQIHGNTPFVSSKTYDSSWFETEKNPNDIWHFSAYDRSSEFRRRLMEDLQRPYDREEFDRLLHEVREKKQKERHRETRHGRVKPCPTTGVNKSYLDLFPDLAKAIDEFKKPEKVLFLLRGFIFWLQNMIHEGTFRPWQDEHCLELLRKM